MTESTEPNIILSGSWFRNQIGIEEIPTTWNPSNEQILIIQQEWPKRDPRVYDGPLWRFEHVEVKKQEVQLHVSRCSYKWHYILRELSYAKPSMYPNPLSVTSLILTEDRKIILGVRQGTDQASRLHAVGGGFLDPKLKSNERKPNMWTVYPEHPIDTAIREVGEETNVILSKHIDLQSIRFIGLVWGRNRDTSCVVVVPIKMNSTDFSLNGYEHSEFVPVDSNPDELSLLIKRGYLTGFEDYPPLDHLILSLKLFLEVDADRFFPTFE